MPSLLFVLPESVQGVKFFTRQQWKQFSFQTLPALRGPVWLCAVQGLCRLPASNCTNRSWAADSWSFQVFICDGFLPKLWLLWLIAKRLVDDNSWGLFSFWLNAHSGRRSGLMEGLDASTCASGGMLPCLKRTRLSASCVVSCVYFGPSPSHSRKLSIQLLSEIEMQSLILNS